MADDPESKVPALYKPQGRGDITVVFGQPAGNAGSFANLEQQLLASQSGKFLVFVEAPGDAMGQHPYAIGEERYSVGFDSESDLVIPQSEKIDGLARDVREGVRGYYASLSERAKYTRHGGMFPVGTAGKLFFRQDRKATTLSHSFPSRFPGIFVNGAAMPRSTDRILEKPLNTIRIGDHLKMVYVDRT